MARAKWKKSPNADLVKAVQDTEDILDFYAKVEDERPVIVLDFQKQTIGTYHYEEYKTKLSEHRKPCIIRNTEKAIAETNCYVLVWDSATGRLVITTFDYDL